MYLIEYRDNHCGVVNLAVGTPKELLSIASIIEKQKILFRVHAGGICLMPKDMGWGHFDYWKTDGESINLTN